jgi:diguanylate cyclase (GGDEF)-like protein
MKRTETEENQKALLNEIIRNADIRSVFQPIVSLRDGSVLGYEALSRGPKGTELENPERLFAAAEQHKALWDLEWLCRSKALSAMRDSRTGATLFLNVNPSVIEDEKFQQGVTRETLSRYDINPANIIFEITEKSAVSNMTEFKQIIRNYKDQDYKIAIDDAGAGYSGLNLISDVRPHYLKLDMNLIRDIDKDSVKQALVRSMQEFARITGTFLIAEGIETLSEMQTLVHIGVHYGQGYFIQRPDPEIGSISPEVVGAIVEMNAHKNHLYGYNLSDIYIGNLCVHTIAVNENVMIPDAYEMLHKHPDTPGFCVTRDGEVRGVVTRNLLNAVVAGVYGYSLYSRKPIASIMDCDFLSMDYKTPVNVAGKLAMARPDRKVYDFITVLQDGAYHGIVTIKDLLNKTIEIEVTNATQLNPLTMLPGNMQIEKALHSVLYSQSDSCVLYFDIDSFKAYNDVYGFENGDRVIRHLAGIITGSVGEEDFVGHVGGDDFVAVVRRSVAEDVCNAILKQFDDSIRTFYKEQDVDKGYIIAKNRQGFEEQYPLVSLSIAGVAASSRCFANIFELSAEASRIKKECKMITGSSYIIV